MKQIANIRKSVCIMANELKKAGYSLSEAFKKAWQRKNLVFINKNKCFYKITSTQLK